MDLHARSAVLRRHGATEETLPELLAYTESRFAAAPAEEPAWPLPDEPFVEAWQGYAARAAEVGAVRALRESFGQLHFPVAAGVSESEAYRAVTRRGEWPPPAGEGVGFVRPEGIRLFLHPTPAGRVPVVVAEAREDFVSLVRAFTRRSEPAPIPDSMGACMVAGLNDWGRIRALRREWEAIHPGAPPGGWAARFREILPRKELYQDRFVILGEGPYSAVPAAELGLPEERWRELSLRIRLEHECAHYFTRRVLGSMRNALHDELIADSTGLLLATGECRPDWLLRFLGLEGFPAYRPGGRLENYRGEPPLSEAAFGVLQRLVAGAVAGAAALDPATPAERADPAWRARRILRLAALPLEAWAGAGASSAPPDFIVDFRPQRGEPDLGRRRVPPPAPPSVA